MINVGLFIPCYIDQFYPQVGIATLQLLERYGCVVNFPMNQTCCGQPMANSGFSKMSEGCDANFFKNFSAFEYVVCPSGSCVLHIKEHVLANTIASGNPVPKVFELTEFLVDVLRVNNLSASFPHRVGLHISCHGQRGLHLSSMSELATLPFSKPEQVLNMVRDIELVLPQRPDECCGFGGTFSVFEHVVSAKMGVDRIREHQENDIEYITSVDSSCLMHLEGILRRKKSKIRTIHIAEILNAG